jgi:phenylalanyl-tRNA synthetase alpha chain
VSLFSTQYLSEKEINLLKILRQIGRRISVEDLSSSYRDLLDNYKLDPNGIQALSELLRVKGLLNIYRVKRVILKTTEKGAQNINEFPEEKLIKHLSNIGSSARIRDLVQIFGEEFVSIALGFARRRGWVDIRGDTVYLIKKGSLDTHKEILKRALNGVYKEEINVDPEIINEMKRRGLLEELVKEEVILELTDKGYEIASYDLEKKILTRLTSDLISTGSWRDYVLKEYNIEAEPPELYPGIKHFYRDFIEHIKEVMISLGFNEINDEIIVPELWNFDVLFQAQDHPAREIHDSLVLDANPANLDIYKDLLYIVKEVHERGFDTGSRGWRYLFDFSKSARLVLRSQTTAATIKYLYEHREPPQRAFIIGKVFRRDVIDARHLPEFYQMDGVIMERDMNLKKLIGVLTQISIALGLGKPIFKPGYFPFTEPSLEGYLKIGDLGYVEIFGSGLFRPEVLRIIGVKYNVGAWGFGVDRLAMAYFKLNDIRDLYTYSLNKLRLMYSASSKIILR